MSDSSENSYTNEYTHPTNDSQVPKGSDISTILLTLNRSTSKDGIITLTNKRSVISAQDIIGWGQLNRGRVAHVLSSAIRHYYKK